MADKVYHSAVDWWLAALLVGCPVAFGVGGIVGLARGDWDGGWTLVAAAVIQALVFVLLTRPTRYTLRSDQLRIRCGLLVWQTVPYNQITSMELSMNPLSAPALSLRRVKINLSSGVPRFVLVSPTDREAFMADLEARVAVAKAKSL